VYVRFRDDFGAITPTYQDDIVLDEEPPTGSAGLGGPTAVAGASRDARRADVTLRLQATDRISGVADMRLGARPDFSDVRWEPFAPSRAWARGGLVYVQYRDRAGNRSPTYTVETGAAAAPTCAPTGGTGPRVSPAGEGRVLVVVVPRAGRLEAVEVGQGSNAVIDVPDGPTASSGNVTLRPPGGSNSLAFYVRRAAPGAATVPLVVLDECGAWPTFVGFGNGT
jgi:hypothetical protein